MTACYWLTLLCAGLLLADYIPWRLAIGLENASVLEPATQLPTAVPYTALVNWIMFPIEAHLKKKKAGLFTYILNFRQCY